MEEWDDGGGGGRSRLGLTKGKEISGVGGGEVEYKTKAGTAWSHSYLNQKPWHPLSYPNQRRKWIAEQTHSQRARRQEEVSREFAQEQEFFRQTALFSKKEKEKVEMMKAVSFMYVRPPGYNAESAKAAELADEKKRSDPNDGVETPSSATASVPETVSGGNRPGEIKKKNRPKDVFGRALPTEEEFEVLKNAPRLETGAPARVKPFAVEIRNVRCVRCGTFGHQSGDRECPLKDVIMPSEESRLKRDDPLTAIMAQAASTEPLKWELKQKPGCMSPPRGGFMPDDPNQQIVAEDIFDEYGGFLSGGDIPALLKFSSKKSKKHSKRKSMHKPLSSAAGESQHGLGNQTSEPESDENRSKNKHRCPSDTSDARIHMHKKGKGHPYDSGSFDGHQSDGHHHCRDSDRHLHHQRSHCIGSSASGGKHKKRRHHSDSTEDKSSNSDKDNQCHDSRRYCHRQRKHHHSDNKNRRKKRHHSSSSSSVGSYSDCADKGKHRQHHYHSSRKLD